MSNKGFTLMEILAVLLVIAVIASFAVPLIKSVRDEVSYQKAKSAGIELAEAVRSFYRDSKGCLVEDKGSFDGADVASVTCPAGHSILTGIPNHQCGEGDQVKAKAVFGCGYISPKTFVDLPYTFWVFNPTVNPEDTWKEGLKTTRAKLITGIENSTDKRCFTVFLDGVVKEGSYSTDTEKCTYEEE